MANKKRIKKCSIEETITAVELSAILKQFIEHDPTAVVCVRQCDGTDFPPYISIESKEDHDRLNSENQFINLLLEQLWQKRKQKR